MRIIANGVVWLMAMMSLMSYAGEKAPTIPRFYLDCAAVQHSFKDGHGACDLLFEMAKLHSDVPDFLAEFWWGRAKRHCSGYIDKVIDLYGRKISESKKSKEKKELENTVKKEIDQCAYAYYHDHWDEITEMIKSRYETLTREMK